jgi:hypothetical protein
MHDPDVQREMQIDAEREEDWVQDQLDRLWAAYGSECPWTDAQNSSEEEEAVMPLSVESAEALDIPESAFNSDGLAVLMVPGGRYGGDWSVTFVGPDDVKFGKIFTAAGRSKQELLNDPRYPYLAAETAFIWLVGQAREQGWRVVSWECFNDQYGEDERPYFCLARAIVASEKFTPAPGAAYADELTLDEAMGYIQNAAQHGEQ